MANRLSELRKKRDLSQAELSNRLGMARTTYAGYENGTREPDNATLQKMADFFETSVDYLLGRTNDKTRILEPQNRKMIDLLDQNASNEEIYQTFKDNFTVGGIPITREEAFAMIQFLRVRRAMALQSDHSSASK